MYVNAVGSRRVLKPPSIEPARRRKDHIERPMLLDERPAFLRAEAIDLGTARSENAAKRGFEFLLRDISEMAVVGASPFIKPDSVRRYAAGKESRQCEHERPCAQLYIPPAMPGHKRAMHFVDRVIAA